MVESRMIGAVLTVERRLEGGTTPPPDADQFVARPATSSRVSRHIGLASKSRRDNHVANPHGASSPYESYPKGAQITGSHGKGTTPTKGASTMHPRAKTTANHIQSCRVLRDLPQRARPSAHSL